MAGSCSFLEYRLRLAVNFLDLKGSTGDGLGTIAIVRDCAASYQGALILQAD